MRHYAYCMANRHATNMSYYTQSSLYIHHPSEVESESGSLRIQLCLCGADTFSMALATGSISLLGIYPPTTINTKGEFISVTTLLLYLKVLEGQD
jgi:hypothetical protein